MHIQNLEQTRIESGSEHARGGGLAGAHFAGQQAHAMMVHQKFQPLGHLQPRRRSEQLLGVRAIGKRWFLEAEERFPH